VSESKYITVRLRMVSDEATPANSASREELEKTLTAVLVNNHLCIETPTAGGPRQAWFVASAEAVGR
jgi:hypothetical protein